MAAPPFSVFLRATGAAAFSRRDRTVSDAVRVQVYEVGHHEEVALIIALLQRPPPKQRAVLLLKDVVGWSA